MTAKIINKGRQFIQHGDNVITLPNSMSTSNFLSILTIHLPRLFDMDVTTRGPGHSPGAGSFASGNMTITTRPSSNSVTGTNTRLLVRLHGGYGYTSGGVTAGGALRNTTERFDDISNLLVTRTALNLGRWYVVGYSLNGFGYTSLGNTNVGPGNVVGNTERFDEAINSQTQRVSGTPRLGAAGYSLNGFGFTSCGNDSIGGDLGTTERFDDVTDSQTTRAVATARSAPGGYGLNNFGFTCGGVIGFAVSQSTVQKFDDFANTQTLRAGIAARRSMAAFSLNGFGFTSCGFDDSLLSNVATTQRFDDVANIQINRINNTNAIQAPSGFSLNGFGFVSLGFIAADTGVTTRFDDITNGWTGVATSINPRELAAGYSTNEYFVDYRTYNE